MYLLCKYELLFEDKKMDDVEQTLSKKGEYVGP